MPPGSKDRSTAPKADSSPASNKRGSQTPLSDINDIEDDRMSTSSCSNVRRANRTSDFERECSVEQSPRSQHQADNKTDLALVPVISDGLLREWADSGFDNSNAGLLGKKALDLLCARTTADTRAEELSARIAQLEAQNKRMRETNVKMQARVEQEEEFISNMLLKRIQKLKSDKETIALKYEEEEENLTNTLSKKLNQLEKQRDELLSRLSQEQKMIMDELVGKVRKLESEVKTNQKTLDQLRREKVDMEVNLEQEQESLFNSLSKRVDHLEAEKRHLFHMVNSASAESQPPPGSMSPQIEARSSSSSNIAASMISGDYGDNSEIHSLRTQLAKARSTIFGLRQRVADVEREKRENAARLVRLTQFERDEPTFDEFCAFVAELNATKLATGAPSIPSVDAEASRDSPCPSESSLLSAPSVQGSISDVDKAGPSPLSSRDISMDCEFETRSIDDHAALADVAELHSAG